MRRAPLLLLMDPFINDWDLQAVVRSCSFAHAEEPAAGARHAAAAAAAREALAAGPPRRQEPAAPAPAPRAEALQERTAPSLRAEALSSRPAPVAGRASAVASKEASTSSRPLYGALEYLDLDHKPFLLPSAVSTAPSRAAGDDGREVMISFPAASVASTSARVVQPGRKAGARTPKPKRSKKSQLKKVVREMPVADGGVSSSDPWAWRKYGQKPIKGSPYPRGYYKCSSMKGCMARKLVERSPAKPGVLIVTYMAEHCHPVPTQLNALAGTTRHSNKPSAEDRPASSPKGHEQEQQGAAADARCDADSNEASATTAPVAAECGGGVEEAAALAEDESEFWPAGMDLDELLAPVDDDFDFEHVLDDDDGVLGRRLSL